MTACDHVRPELGGYVLDALEPTEAEAVRRHLSHCAACAAEHASLAGLPPLLALAEGLDETPPPAPAVEERVLDAVARERAASPAPRRRLRSRRARRALFGGAAAAAAAAVIALAVGLPGGAEESAPAYDVALRPVAGGSASGHAELSGSAGGTTLHLWVRDLPADPGVVYEVLCDAPNWSASAGTFRADTRGRAYVVLTTAARRGEYDAIRVVRRERPRDTDVLTATLN